MDKVYLDIVRTSDNQSIRLGYSSGWGILKNGLQGFGDVDNVISYVDNSARDGGFVTNTRISSKTRTISARYEYPQNNEWMRRQMLAFFSVKSTFEVHFIYGERHVWAEAYIDKFSCSISTRLRRALDMKIQFLFPEPYWKSYEDFGQDIAAVKPMVAFPYICLSEYTQGVNPVGYVGSIFVFQPTVILENDGDTVTYCRVVMNFSGTVTKPTFRVNDGFITLNGEYNLGDQVVIDFEASPPSVELNGQNALGRCDRRSTFTKMYLNTGSNTISYEAEDGSDHMSVVVYYNKRYEAI